MQFKRSELDAVSRAYLRRAETLRGRSEEELPGVFVPTANGWFAGPRGGWGVFLAGGLVPLVLAAGLAVLAAHQPRSMAPVFGGVAAGFVALGLLCMAAGVVRLRRPEPDGPVGDFVFADSSRLWVVAGSTVKVCEYADDIGASGQHFFQNGAYQHTELVVRSSAGVQYLRATHRGGAERLLRFLNAMGQLRQLSEPTFRNLAEMGSARVGLVALRVIDDRSLDGLSYGELTDSPRPAPDPTRDPEPGWGGAVGRALVAGALGVGLFFGLTPAFDGVREAQLFARVEADTTPSVAAMDRYLAEYPNDRRGPTVRQMRDDRVFGMVSRPIKGEPYELPALDRYLNEYPDGRHTKEAQEMRDDHYFIIAERTTAAQDSPAGLRQYLAVPTNTRHRAQAVEKIGVYYDRTVAELKKRADENPDKIDRALMDSLTVLISSLKGVVDPVVTVGFVAELQPDPQTEDEKAREKFAYDDRMNDEPALKEIARRLGTAILPYLEAFDREPVANREKVIHERLADAVKKAIKADILTLRPAQPGEQPMIEVRYKIHPSGTLYLYTITDENDKKTVKGLLRGYAVTWAITLRPPGAAEPLRYTVASQPLSNLKYDSEPSDPDWAVYAIILYSAFYDLSDRMIRAFALDPGPVPNAFTFSATATTKADKHDAPAGLPAPPNWRFNPDTGKIEFDPPAGRLPPPPTLPKWKVNPETGQLEIDK